MFEWIVVWGAAFFASLIILYLLGWIRGWGFLALVWIGLISIGIFYSVMPSSRVQFRDSAPDGWYVQEPYIFEPHRVWFPIDEHYPGTLMGWWTVMEGVNMTRRNGLYCFYLNDNIITEAYLLKVWNSTRVEWQAP